MRTLAVLPLFLFCVVGCDRRTPEEKGRDYAKEKLGFVQGATDELKERGKDIGDGLGKGVGELVKGTGSAVKDVTYPPVKIVLSEQAKAENLRVGQASEGPDEGEKHQVVVHLKAEKGFSGALALWGKGEGGIEVRTLEEEKVDIPLGGTTVVNFTFDRSVRLSKIAEFSLAVMAGKQIQLSEALKTPGVTLSQLTEKKTETGQEVSVYAVFEKPFSGKLSLRAYDEKHTEVGRSELGAGLKQAADSATYLNFPFDARVPLSRVETYELLVAK